MRLLIVYADLKTKIYYMYIYIYISAAGLVAVVKSERNCVGLSPFILSIIKRETIKELQELILYCKFLF